VPEPTPTARSAVSSESSTRHDPRGGGCCAVGCDILDVVIGGAELAAKQLMSETFLDLPGG
jgi:hypothetical protein